MATFLVVLLVAFGILVGVTALIVRGVPRFVRTLFRRACIAAAAVAVIVCLCIPLSLHARAKAIRIGEVLMEPSKFPTGYERWTTFEWLGLCWVDRYFTNDRYNPDCWVAVDLLGRVDLGSKYFVDRAGMMVPPPF
jgi:hypothetical protein